MKLSSPITLEQAAAFLGCTYVGSPSHSISGINEIHKVEYGDLTFVDVAKYYDKALSSKATTILINKEVSPPEGKGLLISENPFRDYNRLTEHLHPRVPVYTHAEPVLGSGARLGKNVVCGENVSIGGNTEIGHNTVIGSNVTIGANTIIYPNVTICDDSIIGSHVCINAGTIIGGEAFYFKRLPTGHRKMLTKGRTIIHDHVDIGANCTIDRGVSGDTIVGEYTKLDCLVQVGHDTVIGKRCIIAAQVGISGVVTVEDDVVLWGQVGVNKDLTIGKGAVLYGKTGVMSSLEGGKTYLGMVAVEYRQKLREIASLRKLPDLIRKLRKGI